MILCHPRKRQQCRVCGRIIRAGEPCVRWTGVISGQGYFTSHAHPVCSRFMDTHWKVFWEDTFPGDYTAEEVHEWEYRILMGSAK